MRIGKRPSLIRSIRIIRTRFVDSHDMNIKKETKQPGYAIRLSAHAGNEELGAMYLYFIRNDSHKEPYALLEDLRVKEAHRKKGIGTALVKEAVAEAKRLGCYKIIATSRMERENVHRLYERLGLKKCGFEFRMETRKQRGTRTRLPAAGRELNRNNSPFPKGSPPTLVGGRDFPVIPANAGI